MKGKKKLKTSTKILIVICIIGLSLLLYPTVANYWNENVVLQVVTEYVQKLNTISEEEYQKHWSEAVKYNQDLWELDNRFSPPFEMRERYQKCLDISGTGVMGYIDIPKIDVSLPVYHGTDDEVLATSVGHLDWTSLPTGGLNTHCVLSAHRGLPSARLFTNLDELRAGDTFTLSILNEVLTYEVDQIRTVEPQDLSELLIQEDKDYCTLVTCTPYGINTHRLLVRGHRVEDIREELHIVAEAVLIDRLIVALMLAIPILFTLFMMVMLKKPVKPADSPETQIPAEQLEPKQPDDASAEKKHMTERISELFTGIINKIKKH